MKMVSLGIDNLEAYSKHFSGKRIGLITNATGINNNFESTIDLMHRHFNLVKLFAPEHGVRGDLQAGITLRSYTDGATGLPVVSLYGANRKPSPDMLDDIDILAFDIQDVGSRFYTYLYTMAYAMEACAENGKTFAVFDRPNPLNGLAVEGNMLDLSCKSFIGLYPIPQRYGLTVGECAALFNAEYGINCGLTVIPMTGYRRDFYFEDTGINWVLPSPNIPTADSCFTFNCSCIFEGANISEGRGTTKPFSFVGAPWLDSDKLADKLNGLDLPGARFRPQCFTPLTYHPTLSKYPGELCRGVEIHVLDRNAFRPVKTGLTMLYAIKELSGDKFGWTPPYTAKGRHMIDYNTGGTHVREGLELDEVLRMYENDSGEFMNIKTKYHLYKE
ncbi:MAG: DUF1343 domain-containing protein [Defluviitaleaceae bacterium]|nr:DUF1343 domain-containing protein [Defluviitaleaceae bacterium]MCL2836155.1 DUF1343 domain-containing protein [Defluviitaleaceae bacterium]